MDSRQAAVLLVLLLIWSHAEGLGGQDEDQIFMVSDAPRPPITIFLYLRFVF